MPAALYSTFGREEDLELTRGEKTGLERKKREGVGLPEVLDSVQGAKKKGDPCNIGVTTHVPEGGGG